MAFYLGRNIYVPDILHGRMLQDAGSLLLCTGQTQHLRTMLRVVRQNRGYRRKALLLLQQRSDPSGEMEMSEIQKQENLGYQSCPDKHASSDPLSYAQIQHLQGREKSLFFLQKVKYLPVIRQRKRQFLSEFSISKECSVTEFVDGKHQGREDSTVCYGLPGFFESASVIKFQRSQAAERPKERSCI